VSCKECEPVGPAEVAMILGVGRSRLYQLRQRDEFPKIAWDLACGPLWLRSEIESYGTNRTSTR